MLVRLGQFTVRKRRVILIASVIPFAIAIAIAIAGAVGGGVADHLSSGGFDDPVGLGLDRSIYQLYIF